MRSYAHIQPLIIARQSISLNFPIVHHFFYASALSSIALVQRVNSEISGAFIDYDDDDDDDDGAADNIDSKFIFQFHLNNTVTGAKESKGKSAFYTHTHVTLKQNGFTRVNEASTKCCIEA